MYMFSESFINNPLAVNNVPERSLEERVRNPRILVIDDEEDVRYLIVRALRKFVCTPQEGDVIPIAQIDEASTLGEAYSYMAQQQYDFIVSDTRLPDGKGYSILDEIKGNRTFPVIGLSSATEIRVNMGESRKYTNKPISAYYAGHWKKRGAKFFDKAIINQDAGRFFAAKVKEVLQADYYPY